MELFFEQAVPASPGVVWRLVTEPDLMNRWSTARIRLVAPGEGGQAGSIGAYRTVDVRSLGRTVRLKEVIEESDPPHRLAYRVVDVPGVRSHRGEITLRATPLGTDLSWRVGYEMALPPLELLTKRMLTTELTKSLQRMSQAALGVSEIAAVKRVPFEDGAHPALWEQADSVLHDQQVLAATLERARDPKRWFSEVYAYVTEAQLEWARSGKVRHPAWVLRLIPRFHDYYISNFRRRMGDESGTPEPHWQLAFDEMEGLVKKGADARRMLFIGLLRGMRAHIEEDLPRALAEVFVDHYASRCGYARFRADYLSMGGIFTRSSERLMELVPRNMVPWYFRGPGRFIPEDLKDSIRRKRYYDLPRARLLAFDRGERLAALLARREKPLEIAE